jgi:2',3'-cyclic-nucleotide 2'-phosphodiesterase (5'-nucleotidase family)
VFGLTAPRIVTYPGLADLDVEDPLAASRRMAKLLRPRVDLLIALTHIGFFMDRLLAEEVPEIDAIVGGDTHTWLERPYAVRPERNPKKVIPIVQDGEFGVKVGRLDLWVRPGRAPGPVARFEGRLIPVTAALPADPAVSRALKPYRTEAGAVRAGLR